MVVIAFLRLFMLHAVPAFPVTGFDARATACLQDDYACLDAHDARVLDAAVAAKVRRVCKNAVAVRRCELEFDLRGGEF